MEGLFWAMGTTIVVGSILQICFSNEDEPQIRNNNSDGFYLNEVDALADGKMFKIGSDDDGPGFYI